MTSEQALLAYIAKAGKKALVTHDVKFVNKSGNRMATVHGVDGKRLALVIDTKVGFTIDLVKKLHV